MCELYRNWFILPQNKSSVMEESLEEKVQMDDAVSTELCLNCGTKLKGEYCHNC